MPIAFTKKELATVAGYTYRRLHDIDRDLGENEKLFVPVAGTDKYDLAIFVQRWVDYKTAEKADDTRKMDDVVIRRERAKAEKIEIEVDRLRGVYVKIQDVRAAWAQVAGVVRARIINLPRKLAPVLVMIEDAETIHDLIDREVRDVLNMIAKTPLPGAQETPDAEEADEEETDE